MNYLGDFSVGAEIYVWFNTFDSNDPSASVTVTDLTDTDVVIYKDDSLTQRANTAGMAIDVDVDTFAGVHKVTIDTADNTVNDFWEAGHDYAVVIVGATVDGASGGINAVVATFSLANRRTAGQMATSSIEGLTDQDTFTLTNGEVSADDDAYNDCIIIVTDQITKIQKAVGYILDYTGATRSVQLYAVPLQTGFTMAVGDSVEIFAGSAFANVYTVNRQTQTANDNGADINTLITQVGTAGDGLTAINLPNQTMDISGDITGNLSGSVGSVTGAVGSVTGAVGSVAGNVDGSIGSLGATSKTDVNAEVDNALDTVLPASPTTGSINDILDRQEEIIVKVTASGSHSTTTMQLDITVNVNDQYNGRILTFRKDTTTANLRGQQTDITDTTVANDEITFTALTTAPSDGDVADIT